MSVNNDPRFIGGVRLRKSGRYEAAVTLLSEVTMAATANRAEDEQLSPELAPVYLEYGVALMCLAREKRSKEAEEQDKERSSKRPKIEDATAEEHEEERSSKRPKIEEEGDSCAVCGLSTVDEGGEALADVLICEECESEVHLECSDLAELPGDDEPFVCGCCREDDGALAWQLVDQARCIYDDAASVARCCAVLGDLDSDSKRWDDALVEYARVLDYYGEHLPTSFEEEVRYISTLVGSARALAEHSAEKAEADVQVRRTASEDDTTMIVVHDSRERLPRARSLLDDAQSRVNALLSKLAAESELDPANKRTVVAIAVELSDLKRRIAELQLPDQEKEATTTT